MKVFFLGSLINDKTLDWIVARSKVKPSNAPVNFENMLIKGMEEAGIDSDVFSLPTDSCFPQGCFLAWGRRKEILNFNKKVTWLPCINLLFLKQFCVAWGTRRELKRWLKMNKDEKDKVVLNYSVYPPYSKATQKLAKKYNVKTCCIISDLPKYLYKMHKTGKIKALLNDYYSRKMEQMQGAFDSYILLTEHMAKEMKIEDKPAILLEGFSDESIFKDIGAVEKSNRKTIMYAGALSESFNIRALLDAFMQLQGDYNLWLFGYGDLIDYICECAQKDRRITYFGKVDRNTLLRHQKAAHLLVSVKSSDEDHANYAFPSKILEYMTSGTAVAATCVGGIPAEYFNYIYPIKGNDASSIRTAIEEVFLQSEDSLIRAGEVAKNYAINTKNYRIQGERIKSFLQEVLEN